MNVKVEYDWGDFMLHYCKKCGRLIQNCWGEDNFMCDCCKTITNPVPNEFLDDDLDCCFKNKNTEQQFINEYIKTSPEFDQYLFDHREEILAKQSAELNAKLEHGKAILAQTPKCPSCGSSNISSIGVLDRAVSFSMVGFASSKLGKTHKCNHCGTTW